MSAALSLDHVGAMVGDLDRGADAWRRLGFTLTRQSPQMGFTGKDGALEPWASANRCAVFERGYLELIGIVDATRFNPWRRFLDRFEGPHIAAFRCDSANDAWSGLQQRINGFDPPVDRRRDAPFGDSGTAEMRFRNIFSQDDHWPEGRFIVIEHQTPEVLWQPALFEHPNTATGLDEIAFVAEDVESTLGRIARLLDAPATAAGDGQYVMLAPGGGNVWIYSRASFERHFPEAGPPTTPSIAGALVHVADIEAARRHLTANDVSFRNDGARIVVPPAAATGMVLVFAPEPLATRG